MGLEAKLFSSSSHQPQTVIVYRLESVAIEVLTNMLEGEQLSQRPPLTRQQLQDNLLHIKKEALGKSLIQEPRE
jgi:hypothetical protein